MNKGEDLEDKWGEYCTFLHPYVAVELEKKAKDLYSRYINGNQCTDKERTIAEGIVNNKKDLKSNLYEALRKDIDTNIDILTIINKYSPFDRVELLEYFIDDFLETGDDEFLQTACKQFLNKTKLENKIKQK